MKQRSGKAPRRGAAPRPAARLPAAAQAPTQAQQAPRERADGDVLADSPRLVAQLAQLRAAFGAALQPPAFAAPGAAVVQAYARVPVAAQKPQKWQAGRDLRVADDGKIAVADSSHDMWATTDIIGQAETALLGLGSPFMLQVGDEVLVGPPPGSQRGGLMRLNKVVPVNTEDGTGGDDMRTIEACSSHGQHMLGSGLNTGDHPMSRGMAVVTGQADVESETRYDKRGSAGDARTDTMVMGDVRAQVTGKPRDEAEEAYGKMSAKDKTAKARELGINQFAEPEVGEGLAVYAAVDKLKKGSFPMHFAGVMAKSGADYVTLENFAKNTQQRKPGDTMQSSKDWYFKMYGPVTAKKDQSFFGELAAEGDYGGREGTMVLKHRATSGYPEPPALADAKVLDALCLAFGQQASMHDFPTFIRVWPAFRKALKAAQTELANAWVQRRDADPSSMATLLNHTQALRDTAAAQDLAAGRQPAPEVKAKETE
ncbi:MAG: hypothetical protein U5L05_00880 [Rubrivivax sp.]|nr:hypothetical protein [Rubrivivax sp.]